MTPVGTLVPVAPDLGAPDSIAIALALTPDAEPCESVDRSAAAAADLWAACRAGSAHAREHLLSDHLGLVYFVARKLARTLPRDADFDDLVSAGTIGLLHAIDRFEPERGLQFSTFALPRIRGAILDERRGHDALPRMARRRLRDIRAARRELAHSLGRAPEPRELAGALGVPLATLWAWEAEVEHAVAVSLEDLQVTTPHARVGQEPHAPESGEAIEHALTRAQEIARMTVALQGLKEKERQVLALYYWDNLKMHQIAELLKVTEGRVSQLRTSALTKLRTLLAPLRMDVG